MLGADGLRARGRTVAAQPEPAGSYYDTTRLRGWQDAKSKLTKDVQCIIYS